MATDTAPSNVRDEFRNTTDGFIGVVQFVGPHREPRGTAVEPRGTVWLNEEEQILTANAPRDDADNPFVNGQLELVSKGTEIKNRRPFGVQTKEHFEEADEAAPAVKPTDTGASPAPEGEAEEGKHAAGEEVATPSAVTRPKPERAQPRRKKAA